MFGVKTQLIIFLAACGNQKLQFKKIIFPYGEKAPNS
jgi:hypothetical protein